MGQNCCSELMEMISSLLDISRMESGQMPLNRSPAAVCDIARSAAESVSVLARKKRMIIQVYGDSGVCDVDSDIMQRVFVNLLGNAIKFAPDDSIIGINIVASSEKVRITVTDEGPGIPPEYHQKIFEKFGQVDSRYEEQKHSSGLGLTFCKLAVEAHGGSIGIESPSTLRRAGTEENGSTFWLTIPKSSGMITRSSGGQAQDNERNHNRPL